MRPQPGLVSEYGLVAPKELHRLRVAIPAWLEDAENGLTAHFRRLPADLQGDLTGRLETSSRPFF